MCDAPPRSQIMMTDLPRPAPGDDGAAACNRSTSGRVSPATPSAPTRSTSRREIPFRYVRFAPRNVSTANLRGAWLTSRERRPGENSHRVDPYDRFGVVDRVPDPEPRRGDRLSVADGIQAAVVAVRVAP